MVAFVENCILSLPSIYMCVNGKDMNKICLFDSDTFLLERLGKALKDEGYCVLAYPSLSVINMDEVETADLLVLDVHLPDGNGLTWANALKRNYGIPFIATSTGVGSATSVNALSLGADDFLLKPYSVRELALRCKALLGRLYGDSFNPKKTSII